MKNFKKLAEMDSVPDNYPDTTPPPPPPPPSKYELNSQLFLMYIS